jgi:hypothetical protein
MAHGAMGEGMAMSRTRDGRRIMWLAHEHAPRNFTGVDVTDPRRPKVVVHTDLAHMDMRSNSLDVVGDLLAVAYQSGKVGGQPAGLELFDISVPESPRSVSFFDSSGPYSRGVHALDPNRSSDLSDYRRARPLPTPRGGSVVVSRLAHG